MDKVSKTEIILLKELNRIGLFPETQYPISKMHVDFAFPKQKLVIEVDGAYKRNSTGMKTLFERKRVCEEHGWKVENFTAEETYSDPQKIAWRIKGMLKKLPVKDDPPYEKEQYNLTSWNEGRKELSEVATTSNVVSTYSPSWEQGNKYYPEETSRKHKSRKTSNSWELKKEIADLDSFSEYRLLLGDKATEILILIIKVGAILFGLIGGFILTIISFFVNKPYLSRLSTLSLKIFIYGLIVLVILYIIGLLYRIIGNIVNGIYKSIRKSIIKINFALGSN